MRCKETESFFRFESKLKASEKKRSDGFELTGEKTSTLTKQVLVLKEQMENKYVSIHNNMEEENLKIHTNLAILKDDKTARRARKRGNERPG